MDNLDDWEDMRDSDFSVSLSSKLNKLLIGMQEYVDDHLMEFTVEELQSLQKVYGSQLTYALYKDIQHAMSLPKSTDTVH
jgi:hypothetical protein